MAAMRATTRLTLVLGATGLLLFGVFGVVTLRSEAQDAHRAVVRELDLLGRSLQVAVENALRDRQIDDIQETLDRLETIDPGVDIYVADSTAELHAASIGAAPGDAEAMAALRAAMITGVVVLHQGQMPRQRLLLGLPLRTDDGRLVGALAVSRPTDDVAREIATLTRQIWLLVAVFAVVVAAIGHAAGHWLIGRPLARMADAMAVLDEDRALHTRFAPGGGSEIRRLGAAFVAMLERLRSARVRLDQQQDERRAVERGLVRADKLITIGQLSAGLAHEIGSPLQILAGRARGLRAKADDPAEVMRIADILVTQAERIGRIVDALLATTRRRPAQPQRVAVAAPLERVLELVAAQARRRGVRIEYTDRSNGAEVLADPDHLQQIALNLLGNALNFCPRGQGGGDGGGTVALSLSRRVLGEERGPLRQGQSVVALRVRDDGPGVDPALRERIFEPFFSTRVEAGGTGLGLAVARALAAEHGGVVDLVESDGGSGATFELLLPVVAEAT